MDINDFDLTEEEPVWEEFVEITPELIEMLGFKVISKDFPLSERMRAIFTLKSMGSDEAVDVLKNGMYDESVLLGHEVAYCLGQMKNPHAVPALIDVLKNEGIDSMVRHEAAEALGAIGERDCIPVLEEYAKHPVREICETCIVAIDLINWRNDNKEETHEEGEGKEFHSIDPAPPSKKRSVEELKEALNDQTLTIFERYRALFKLRNIGTEEAVLAISSSLYDDKNGPLFLHEVCYVLGQLQHPASLPALTFALQKKENHSMVRHEAAEAIGNVGNEESLPLLKQFREDEIDVVKDSCEVALDIHHYNNSDEFQYANAIENPYDVV